MTLSTTGTAQLQKPVNVAFMEMFLRRALPLAPYFAGTKPGTLQEHAGTGTAKWRRVEALTESTAALSEITTASYMQGRTPSTLTFTDVTATALKYGDFVILTEEVDLFNPNPLGAEIMEVIGEAAGKTINALQRNIAEDNLTQVFQGGGSSAGTVIGILTEATLNNVLNTLDRNDARTFMPMSTGSENVGTQPILESFWGICHPDVAHDIANMTNFKSVETYAGQVATAPGEFGYLGTAGVGIRFIRTSTATIDAGAGAAVTSQDVRATSAQADVYTTVIYGRDALGSLGLGSRYTDGIFRVGDKENFEIIQKDKGSGGTSDPFNEIRTVAYKAWHSGAVLNATWGRAVLSAATNLSN